ncbi:MAG: DUF4450 domain-containing protein, partial [Tepidisphaeraceae bacterium]
MTVQPHYHRIKQGSIARRCAGMMLCVLSAAGFARAATPLLRGQIDRPLRYTPQGNGVEIDNGEAAFNRPLYGGYTAFRVDAGDRPQFSLYLPGRGGVVRVGLSVGGNVKWLQDAASVRASYADAAMAYRIQDPAFSGATLRLKAVALRDVEGFGLRVDVDGVHEPAQVLIAFGGVTGDRGMRDGDIGCEKVPVSQFFAPKASYSKDNTVEVRDGGFTVRASRGTVDGACTANAKYAIADANDWEDLAALVRSA